MTWAQFKTLVGEFLPLDVARAGAATLIERLTKSGALDLVRYLPSYENPTEVRIPATDGARVQNGLLFELDAGTLIDRAEIATLYEDPDSEIPGSGDDDGYKDAWRGKLTILPWMDRFKVIQGYPDNAAAFDPATAKFMSPFFDGELVELVINRRIRPTDWVDADVVPFTHQDAEAVSYFIQAHIARTIDKNPRLSAEHRAEFVRLRRELFVERK